MHRLTRKIKTFDSDGSGGILASIGGISLAFTCANIAGSAAAFTVGQIVIYQDTANGQLERCAGNVRAHTDCRVDQHAARQRGASASSNGAAPVK
jgi:hypothetical protein